MQQVDELLQEIEIVNKKIESLNTERNQNIGRKNMLEARLQEGFEAYKLLYGVELSEENLETEYERLVVEKTTELEKVKEVLECIDNGDIEKAKHLLGVSSEKMDVENVGVKSNDNGVQVDMPKVAPPPKVTPPTPQVSNNFNAILNGGMFEE